MRSARMFLLALAASPAGAMEPVKESDDTELPDDALLEFLGSFEDDDGVWTDPLELEKLRWRDTDDKIDEDEDAPEN